MRWGVRVAAAALAVAVVVTMTATAAAAIAPAPLCARPPKHGWVPATSVPRSVVAKIDSELRKRGLCARPTIRPTAACSQAQQGAKAYQVVVLVHCPLARLRLRVQARVQVPVNGRIKALGLTAKRLPAPPRLPQPRPAPPRQPPSGLHPSSPPAKPPPAARAGSRSPSPSLAGSRVSPPPVPLGTPLPKLPLSPSQPCLELVPPLPGCGWNHESWPLCFPDKVQYLLDQEAFEAVDAKLRKRGLLVGCPAASYIPGIQLTGACQHVDASLNLDMYLLTYEIECGGERLAVRATVWEPLKPSGARQPLNAREVNVEVLPLTP